MDGFLQDEYKEDYFCLVKSQLDRLFDVLLGQSPGFMR